MYYLLVFFFFSSRRRHTRCSRDWSSDVCSSDLHAASFGAHVEGAHLCVLGKAVGGHGDRKSVVQGKSVDLGGRRIIKKKKKKRSGTRMSTTTQSVEIVR